MSNQAVEVEILGKLTRVNCPEGQEESLIEAAQDLDDRLREMTSKTKVTNEVQLLTIAALNCCYELKQSSKVSQDQQSELFDKVEKLSESLEQALSRVRSAS
ncbi:cell division protein ZapA [Vibrio sp. S4M6]|uniref:cell division protein ZapA n=1 Tax=Vibrio sinus TaxID=2946865 RepID=UPI002029E87E|nr:cell division protein ZapA [Vibrio sinus]MCL9781564.1 cell division protein ZapA [Vibrio sinus]